MLHEEERKIFAKINFRASFCRHSDLHILNSKVIQQYQVELFGTEVYFSDTNQQRGRQTRPKHHTCKDVYKDHVYLDRLFLLSNLTWHRAHVTAGLTGRDPNVNVLRRFRSGVDW